MLSFRVDVDSSDIIAQVTALKQDRIPKALKDAANHLGSVINKTLRDEISIKFDKPVPYTERALDWTRATIDKPMVRIWIKDDPNKGTAQERYLTPQIRGGQRGHKRFERALILKGLMRSDEYAVPAYGAPRDGYGNVPGSYIVRMLSDLQALGDNGYRSNRKGPRKGKRRYNYWFGVRTGDNVGLKPGIYYSSGASLPALVFMFTRSPNYRVRYPFYEIATRLYNSYRDQIVGQHIAKAIYSNR